jgi:hypothetical protein
LKKGTSCYLRCGNSIFQWKVVGYSEWSMFAGF